ncbi:hypothetical protein KAFR_0H00470 [Kazachstania africana CBS 2517]|uniref:uroporphyrinogen-III C-methyltransferase n=1 Tax=Kazachstania africana (strain ATCC 22294 / BCRC 22015 / CBS 2517 / CECT 1963 / NBRC 1671 / NRRL Y-8276) TaxID=1071382 RepID=H2AYQ0_KAZAF|nr:hypothetical protein KAFR_0H00470 [Kazachstania africana CBS 2517]CCF59456.1 hypothetical protein KAFR_0H00470 [Kazachstania africana CBS 2517]
MLHDSLSLITATKPVGEVFLLVGTGSSTCSAGFTNSRIKKLLGLGVIPVVVNPSTPNHVKTILKEFEPNQVELIEKEFTLSYLTTLGRQITGKVVDRVIVNLPYNQGDTVKDIYDQCIKLRIPINTYQQPEYSTFSMIPTYNDSGNSGLQISVTTNGKGYILDDRIRREIVNKLPSNISEIVKNMGHLRDQLIAQNNLDLFTNKFKQTDLLRKNLGFGLDCDNWESHKFNELIKDFETTKENQQFERTRWLSQIIEYFPFSDLSQIKLSDLQGNSLLKSVSIDGPTDYQQKLPLRKTGSISLVGTGPGSVSMLTLGALKEIKTADIILSDKLVPQQILDLVPSDTELFIARKFPGNAERAQTELLELGLHALKNGKKVVRLKQGDPYIFGRGGEEHQYFHANGFKPTVLPGISSPLASTVTADIPATQRNVSDQVLICTGTSKDGGVPNVPEYVSTRTTIFLMALHRVKILKEALIKANWSPNIKVAIVERVSCPDQRITTTLLKYLPSVVEEIGSRPPGLLVIGPSVGILSKDPVALEFNDSCKYHMKEGYQLCEVELDELLVNSNINSIL